MRRCVWGDAEDYWRDQVLRWEESGWSAAEYCRQSGVSLWSFYAWRRRLEQESDLSGGFAPVEIAADDVVMTHDSGVEIAVGGDRRIVLRRGFDEATLLRALKVLEGC